MIKVTKNVDTNTALKVAGAALAVAGLLAIAVTAAIKFKQH